MTLSMPVLPDCTRCGASVVLVIDGDGAREECVSCGLSQKPMPPKVNRQEVRGQARQVVEQARREGLPVMRCPSCKQDRHDRCHASGCECVKGEHPRRPSVSREIPGNAWTFSVTFDGDTHWLECDHCEQPVCPIEAGDVLEDLLVKADKHICGPADKAVTRAQA